MTRYEELLFYWNWLARVAKSDGVQRKAVVKLATSKSPIIGKTAILAVALTTQTTGPSAQSAEMPTLSDLPDPGPVPEPAFPPVPPGTFTCWEYYSSMRNLIDNQNADLHQAIERTYNAKCKPFNDKIDDLTDEIDNHRDQYLKKVDRWLVLYQILYLNVNEPRITNLEKEIAKYKKEIEKLQKQIFKLVDDLGKIYAWHQKIVKWANEKHRKENEALDAHYGDCLANETDDD